MRSITFGIKLQQSRIAAGLTLGGLAEALDNHEVSVTEATIDAWERGDWGSADVQTFKALDDILGFHPVWPNIPA